MKREDWGIMDKRNRRGFLHPNWKGGVPTGKCLLCRSLFKSRTGTYCSKRCVALDRRNVREQARIEHEEAERLNRKQLSDMNARYHYDYESLFSSGEDLDIMYANSENI